MVLENRGQWHNLFGKGEKMIAQAQWFEPIELSNASYAPEKLVRESPQLSIPLESNSMDIESPPLSPSEIVDIQASEGEFASGQTETYDSPQDLIAALHAAREEHRRNVGGQ